MKTLFETIIRTNPTIGGWCEIDKAIHLASMVVALQPECVLEIGVFSGRSLIPMALALKAVGSGVIIGIDPWSKEVAVREQISNEHRKWWDECPIEKIYQDFIGHINKLDLNKHVTVIRQESRFVQPPAKINILHVDGSHGDTTVNDVIKFAPRVVAGGFLIMDDTDGTHGPAPMRAVQWLKQTNWRELYNLGTGKVFQR